MCNQCVFDYMESTYGTSQPIRTVHSQTIGSEISLTTHVERLVFEYVKIQKFTEYNILISTYDFFVRVYHTQEVMMTETAVLG